MYQTVSTNSRSITHKTAVNTSKLLTDSELVAAIRNGEELAFRELFERYQRLVARVASRFFQQREHIEEIVQVAFTEMWRSLASFENRHERSFASWLTRITINSCYDELRRIGRRKEDFFSQMSDEEMQTLKDFWNDPRSQNAERATIARDLAHKLLARLTPEDRLVLTLLKVEEWSIAEIADFTGWTCAKVKMRVHRARGIFQKAKHRVEHH
jgi:RNA polymerase sigma-70 factor, ECF subfamily